MPVLPGKPINREPPVSELISSFLTTDGNYERNHCLHPQVKAIGHRVRVNGLVHQALELSVSDLANDFRAHSVVCALQCAGNRRHTMRTKMKEVQGIDWFDGAVMNCQWRGPLLQTVLDHAGISLPREEWDEAHVAFACHSVPCQDDSWYGASIPLSRAMDSDNEVILALEMNGNPLRLGHGYPVRIITPGLAGARAVKWLDTITVQRHECQNHYMQRDYKILPEEAVDAASADKFWNQVSPVMSMPVNSVVARPMSASTVLRDAEGKVLVQGYALPSGDHGPIVKVEVSVDGGLTWQNADLEKFDGEGRWSWKLWQVHIKMNPSQKATIYSRAIDAGGHMQPETARWNLRGVCYNGFGEAKGLIIE